MSEETRQALKTVLVAVICVAALTALAWWSVMGMVFVALAFLTGLAVGWRLGGQHVLEQANQACPTRRRPPGERTRGGTKR